MLGSHSPLLGNNPLLGESVRTPLGAAQRPLGLTGWHAGIYSCILASVVACSGGGLDAPLTDPVGSDQSGPAEANSSGSWAQFRIERARSTNLRTSTDTVSDEPRGTAELPASNSATGQAMANFVLLPNEPAKAREIAGLRARIPRVDECLTDFGHSQIPLTSLQELDLLDAGTITLLPNGKSEPVILAPRAFPSVSSFAAGVVYTTRDRAAANLPPNVEYEIRVSGSEHFPALEVSGVAPPELSAVTLGGEPLAQVNALAATAPLDFTWAVGEPDDVVYVDIEPAGDGQTLLRCAFADERGAGSIAPLESLLTTSGFDTNERLHLAVHRQRTYSLTDASELSADLPGSQRAQVVELRFDFELSHDVLLAD